MRVFFAIMLCTVSMLCSCTLFPTSTLFENRRNWVLIISLNQGGVQLCVHGVGTSSLNYQIFRLDPVVKSYQFGTDLLQSISP